MAFEDSHFEGGEDAEAESPSARWIEDARNLPDFSADDEAVINRILEMDGGESMLANQQRLREQRLQIGGGDIIDDQLRRVFRQNFGGS